MIDRYQDKKSFRDLYTEECLFVLAKWGHCVFKLWRVSFEKHEEKHLTFGRLRKEVCWRNILITIRRLLNTAELIRVPTFRVCATPSHEDEGGEGEAHLMECVHPVRQNIHEPEPSFRGRGTG